MLNKKPIIIVSLSRGGSSVILNILRSHPDVCSPRGETHEVFAGKNSESYRTRAAKILAYLPVVLLQREHIWSMRNYRPRRPLSARSAKIIDRILYEDKLLATDDTQNRFRKRGVEYTQDEIRAARLLCKNVDALAFVTPLLAGIYPDAVFLGLVRNGLASCEGHVRRGKSAAEYGRLYSQVCGRIADDEERMRNFHLLRYETLTSDVLAAASDLYELSNLDSSRVSEFRLVVGDNGRTGGEAERLAWYTPAEFSSIITPSLDEEQSNKLSTRDRDAFLREAGSAMERLGYI